MTLIDGVIAGGGIGAILGGIYAFNPNNLPSAIIIGNTLKSPMVWGLIALYYVMSIILLWIFLKPKSTEQVLSVITGGILWGTF